MKRYIKSILNDVEISTGQPVYYPHKIGGKAERTFITMNYRLVDSGYHQAEFIVRLHLFDKDFISTETTVGNLVTDFSGGKYVIRGNAVYEYLSVAVGGELFFNNPDDHKREVQLIIKVKYMEVD